MESFYVKEGDTYYFMEGQTTTLVGKKVALGYSVCPMSSCMQGPPGPDDVICMLHKHGTEEEVEAWLDESIKKMVKAGAPVFAEDLKMITSSNIDPGVLNMMLANPKYLGRWLEKEKIIV